MSIVTIWSVFLNPVTNSCTCRVCIWERSVQVSPKSSKAWLRYERNKYTNKLIHKPQAHSQGQRVCEENKLELELEKKQLPVKMFCS